MSTSADRRATGQTGTLDSGTAHALAGWITLAVLEHDTRHALGIWTALGVSVLAVSFAPIALAGASPSSKAALSLIHLSVAGVLLVTMRRNTAQR
jgi:Family of unknown function (DUF6069)